MSSTKLILSSATVHKDLRQLSGHNVMVVDSVFQHMTSSAWRSEMLMLDYLSQDIRVTHSSVKDSVQEAGKQKMTGTLFVAALESIDRSAH